MATEEFFNQDKTMPNTTEKKVRVKPNPGPTRGELLRLVRKTEYYSYAWAYGPTQALKDEQEKLEQKILRRNKRWVELERLIKRANRAGRSRQDMARRERAALLQEITLVVDKPGPALVKRVRAYLKKYGRKET